MEDDSRKCSSHCHSTNDFCNNGELKAFLKNACNQGVWTVCTPGPDPNSIPEDPEFELERLNILKSYNVLDQDTDASFERVTSLAARLFDVPICLVSIVDLGRQWFASNRGLGETRETERNIAFCAHVILSNSDMMIIPDATKDERFKNNPLVTSGPKIRFYAGAPLVTPDGFKLGTFCIIDTKPWPKGLNMSQKLNLLEMSSMVMDTIVLRKKDREFKDKQRNRFIASTAHEMLTPLTTMQLNLGLLNEDKSLKENMSEATKEILKSTYDCVGLLTTICNQSIDAFRSSHQSFNSQKFIAFKSEEVVIKSMLEKVKHFVKPYLQMIPVTFNVADDVPPMIKSNSLHLSTALMNILVDSIESAKFKSGSITVLVSVERSEDHTKLLVECTKLETLTVLGDDDENFRIDSASKHVTALGGNYGMRLW